MKLKPSVKTESQRKGRGGKVLERGGGYADPKAAMVRADKKTKSKPSEKVKGGGYGDAKGVSGKTKTNNERGAPETTKQPF